METLTELFKYACIYFKNKSSAFKRLTDSKIKFLTGNGPDFLFNFENYHKVIMNECPQMSRKDKDIYVLIFSL